MLACLTALRRFRRDLYSLLVLAGLLLFATLSLPTRAQVSVLTQHNDNSRTGANLNEALLTPAKINANTFGRLFTRQVDGEVYAQPLVVAGLNIGGKTRNVVFVATMNNSLYAFDADDAAAVAPLWQRNFGPPVPVSDLQIFPDISTSVGILSTPVIDPAGGTLYCVNRNKNADGSYHQWIRAIDLLTGNDRANSPREIAATLGQHAFDPKRQNQRPALLLLNGVVYVAWASHNDIGPYHGWLMGFDAASLQFVSAFDATPTGDMAGIWQGGQGPTADAYGNLYVMTGNGTFDANTGGLNFGCSFLKINPANNQLTVTDWFTPFNVDGLNANDEDLGSGGVLGIPGTQYLTGMGKEGRLYLLNSANMGHFHAGSDSQIVQSFNATNGAVFSSPIWFNSPTLGKVIGIWSDNDYLRLYKFNGTTFDTTPVAYGPYLLANGMPGGILSLSANGSVPNTGLIWASHPYMANAGNNVVPGILRCYDASQVVSDANGVPRVVELWNSRMRLPQDDIGNFAKFCAPTIANGKVYMASFGAAGSPAGSGQLVVYGLLGTAPPEPYNLTAKAGNQQVVLNWTAGSYNTSFNVYRSTVSGGGYAKINGSPVTGTTYTDAAVVNEMPYYYVVTGVNAAGMESGYSNEAQASPTTAAYRINAGGGAVGSFSADSLFTGGAAFSTSPSVDTGSVTNPAPASAYQTQRADFTSFSYSLPGLTANGSYQVRLHFAEVYWTVAGQRPFDVSINGVQVLSNFDIFTAAGAANKAVIREFNVSADSSGKIGILFSSPANKAPCVCAIEVLSSTPDAPSTPTGLTATAGNAQVVLAWNTVSNATSYNLYRSTTSGGEGTTPYKTGLTSAAYTDTGLTNGTTYYYKVSAVNTVGESNQSSEASATPTSSMAPAYQINAGGPAVGTFSADNFFTGGAAYSTSPAIDTSGVTNPAPAAAYQTQRADFSQFSYSLPGLTANGSYKVRLHFAEVYWTVAGQRPFDVFINGVQVLFNFDIFTAAGAANKAVVKEFNVSADGNGKLNLVFSSPSNKAPCVCAIEVVATTPQLPATPTGLTATAVNAQVALTWNAVSGATTYNLYRATSAGGEGTTPYKTGRTSAAYTDTGLTNGTTYFYKVSAVNSVGESSQSSEASATPSASAAPLYQINAGGGAIGTFSADNFFTGGAAYSTSPAIDTSGVTNPAPASAYQTQRADFSQFSYSLPGLTANGSYKVRLHFAEVYWTVAGQRPFDVFINGVQVLSNFDIFTAAGAANKAVVREFNVTADATGKLNLVFSSPNNKAPCVCAIEVYAGP